VIYASSIFSVVRQLRIHPLLFVKLLIHKHNQLVRLQLAQSDPLHHDVILRYHQQASSPPASDSPISTCSKSTSFAYLMAVVLMLLFSKIYSFSKFLSLFAGHFRASFTCFSPHEDIPELALSSSSSPLEPIHLSSFTDTLIQFK
jgi:hypothetical protein